MIQDFVEAFLLLLVPVSDDGLATEKPCQPQAEEYDSCLRHPFKKFKGKQCCGDRKSEAYRNDEPRRKHTSTYRGDDISENRVSHQKEDSYSFVNPNDKTHGYTADKRDDPTLTQARSAGWTECGQNASKKTDENAEGEQREDWIQDFFDHLGI